MNKSKKSPKDFYKLSLLLFLPGLIIWLILMGLDRSYTDHSLIDSFVSLSPILVAIVLGPLSLVFWGLFTTHPRHLYLYIAITLSVLALASILTGISLLLIFG